VIFVPSRKLGELLTFPVMEPSSFCTQLARTGILSLGASLAAGLGATLGPPPKNEVAGFGAGLGTDRVARAGAGFGAGLGTERVARAGAGFGAGLGTASVARAGGAGFEVPLPPPKKLKGWGAAFFGGATGTGAALGADLGEEPKKLNDG
jgi:hypothetical protein